MLFQKHLKEFKKLGFNFKSNIDNAISETLKRIENIK